MRFFKKCLCLALAFSLLQPVSCFAEMGDMGFFGGISEGTRLPKSTEIIINQNNAKTKTTKATAATGLKYKEVVFISGKPEVFEGVLTVKTGTIKDTDQFGSYTETHTVKPTAASGATLIDRTVTFNVNFRKEGNQVIKDYEVTRWDEAIKTQTATYTLDPTLSHFGVSIIEDHNAAAVYYKGNISQNAVYTTGTGDEEQAVANVTTDVSGSFYGYRSAWSSSEVHRIDATVDNGDWQMQYQIRPSVSVSKLMQYDKNEPQAISFEGNYKEIMQNTSGLEYNIFVKPAKFADVAESGKINIPVYNSFEQLIAPKGLTFLKGHFAESDIKKLFSMQVLSGDAKLYKPEQAMTRGQFVSALVKAIKLPITPVETNKRPNKNAVVSITFPDVTEDRPEYPYIMAAFENGIAIGRDDGKFYIDKPIDRQEAFAIMLRTLGLQNLGLDPTPMTPFTDDAKIGNWAKSNIYAAYRLGIIDGDENGNLRPMNLLSKADGAALLNRLIDYMRQDLANDYTDHIVGYAN